MSTNNLLQSIFGANFELLGTIDTHSKMSQLEIEMKIMMLVNGFINSMDNYLTQIIPIELNKLCFFYFYVEPIEILNDKRIDAKKNNDSKAMLELEHLILSEICSLKYNQETLIYVAIYPTPTNNNLRFYCDILREILNRWIKEKKMEEFRNLIVESIEKCIKNDSSGVLRTMLRYCNYDKIRDRRTPSRSREITHFINTAAKNASLNCISLLLKFPERLDWGSQRRPMCLLNAIKYHPYNSELIYFIMEQLEKVKTMHMFMCDDVMKEAIRYDLVGVVKRIIDNRWHKVTEQDELHAQLINLKCNELFMARSNAFMYYKGNDDNELNLEDEWGDGDDEFEEDDDDWKNAEEM